jgi:hypothetical protein
MKVDYTGTALAVVALFFALYCLLTMSTRKYVDDLTQRVERLERERDGGAR